MNQHLQTIADWLQQNTVLSEEEKGRINKSLKDANKELEITAFKLTSTERVKRTTSVLLEETIEELEQKRKAVEAQNCELGIEASLERVRSRSLAMNKSDELKEVIQIVHDQLAHLNILVEHAGFIVNYKEWDDMHIWLADKHEVPAEIFISYFDSPHWNSFKEAKATGKNFFTNSLTFEEKNKFYGNLFQLFPVPDEAKEYYFSCPGLAISTVLLDTVGLYIENFSGIPYSDKDNKTLMRFGKVFQQTYTRFNDLQKAEAQSREAQIEAALESVRSSSLAMHRSDQLKSVAAVMFKKLMELGLALDGAFIFLYDEPTRNLKLWIATTTLSEPGEINIPYSGSISKNQLFKELWRTKETGEEFFNRRYSGTEKNDYFRYIGMHNDFPQAVKDFHLNAEAWITSIVGENHCAVGFDSWNGRFASPEDYKILKRFARAFEQAYVRFLDLQKAETQAKESQIEAALERVRARTMAMQKSDELAETSAVLFKQLIGLGISPSRLYISIMKDEDGDTEFWITDEDGSKVSMAYEDNLNNNTSFKKMFDGWKGQQISLVVDMKGEELQEYLTYLNSIHVPFKGGLTQKRRVQYIAYFSKGFIGMASPDEQPVETLQLLERFAYVFNLTFTRFHDLQIAEAHALQAEQDLIEIKAARRKAEDALSELQVTQRQLIQSEKMASLGELTAGIAHKIQNPLNFVNNFSEVSKELLDEMKAALESGDKKEAEEIANDIINNLEKINHHGKRADAIVKGMLQHSRQTKGIKEPTDINALCDEYLRLSYHGLRAKDKFFNADFTTDFDESVGKISIVPQDIGRVLLNLFNNAFYAVSEKKKIDGENYKPLISIQTKKVSDTTEIRIEDNGNGIPNHIIDKIFQPFFTTKPTGQGTGLGLSLAYDIITKEHNGTLQVESKQNEGSSFKIILPL